MKLNVPNSTNQLDLSLIKFWPITGRESDQWLISNFYNLGSACARLWSDPNFDWSIIQIIKFQQKQDNIFPSYTHSRKNNVNVW